MNLQKEKGNFGYSKKTSEANLREVPSPTSAVWCDDQGGGDGDTTHVSFLAPAPPPPLGISPPPGPCPRPLWKATSTLSSYIDAFAATRALPRSPCGSERPQACQSLTRMNTSPSMKLDPH